MMKFEIGNEVRLKSGGPRMIVEAYALNNLIVCSYIHNSGEQRKEIFLIDLLETAGRMKYCPRELME